jgi:hypothetical protein
MKIAVLVSVGRHPVSGTARYSRNDAAALTIALSLAKTHGATLDVLHAGDPSNPALKEYLALGARTVEVLEVPESPEWQGDAIRQHAAIECAFGAGAGQYKVVTAQTGGERCYRVALPFRRGWHFQHLDSARAEREIFLQRRI